MSDKHSVGVLGLGAMGLPMAERMLAAGLAVTAYDPTPEAVQAAVRAGAAAATTAAQAAHGTRVALCMVATPRQATAALLGPDGVATAPHPPEVVVLSATVGPAAAGTLAEGLWERGIGLVDAPVSGGVARAERGDLLVMAAGRDEDLIVAGAVLDSFGSSVQVVGTRPGDGQAVKLVNQLVCGAHIVVAAEALGFAAALGLDPARVREVIRGGAAASFMLDDRGERMTHRRFDDVRSAVDIFVKDMRLVAGAARARDYRAVVAEQVRQVFEDTAARGWGRLDDSAVLRWYEER